jgi:integrase
MARIYKREKSWYIDIRVGGQRFRKRVGTSKKIAELALKDAEVKAAKDEFGLTKNDITLQKLTERFLEYSQINHSPATTVRYASTLRAFQDFMHEKYPKRLFVSQVSPEILEQFKIWRKSCWVNPNGMPVESDTDIREYTRKGALSLTVNFEIKVLTTLFNVAIDWGYLKENPTKKVKRLKITDSKQMRFLTEEECSQLLAACPSDLYLIFYTFLATGMRKSELEHLEWTDIDFKRGKIKVQRKDFWKPKSKDREIPMSDQLRDMLATHKTESERRLKSNFVFPHKDGSKIKMKLREKLIQIAKQAGIPDLTRVHTLRHTFASHLVMKGVDLPTVMKLMGHSDIQTTMIYAHLAPDHLADAVNRLEF